MSFPITPTEGEIYNDYKYNNGKWDIKLDDEVWHYIGEAGEPAFQNGWLDYGQAWGRARFRRDLSGTIHMDGLVKNGTAGSPIFILPEGYRPSNPNDEGLHVPICDSTWDSTTASSAILYVMKDGRVYNGSAGSNAWVSLVCSFSAKE